MPAPDWLTRSPIAHRGLYTDARPENSLAAIEAAAQAGFPVEIDVQMTVDGYVVVYHDWSLLRLTGHDARVSATSLSTLQSLRLAGTDEIIPRLEEVFELVNGRTPIVIEIKNRRYPTSLEPALSRLLSAYEGPFAIQSFNPYSLGWFRLRHPRFPRGQISCAFDTDDMAGWKKIILSQYGMNWMTAPDFISHQFARLPAFAPGLVRRLFRIPLIAWTIRSQDEMARALRVADNVVFERFVPVGS